MPASDSNKTILLVDDEEIALSSLNALFSLETDYETISFSNPNEAIEAAKHQPIDLVISDYLMPQMTGIDLLKQLKGIQPDMMLVLLTGFADKENTIRAINELDLFQYLEKPWDNQQLLLAVERGLRQRSLTEQLTAKVKELDNLLTEHRDLQQRHSSMERELEMAARVQRSLLPQEMPEVYGFRFGSFYHPCHEIGGDFYGLKTDKESATLILADVSGHGIQAALTSMLLKATFEEIYKQTTGPVELVQAMNDALFRFLPSGMYAAATVARMQYATGRLQLVNAGLPYPYILKKASGKLEEIPIAGMPMGIFGKDGPASFDTKEIRLEPGDVILLASDGIGDIQGGASDELFQDLRLRETLSELVGCDGEELIEKLVAEAMAFARNEPIPDDISLVSVTRA